MNNTLLYVLVVGVVFVIAVIAAVNWFLNVPHIDKWDSDDE